MADGQLCRVMGVLRARRLLRRRRRDHIGNEVDDQVGFDVAQDQVAAEEPVLEFFGQRRQLQQQAGGTVASGSVVG